MTRFVEGCDRGQSTFFPALLDDYVATHACHAREVERNVSNLVAHLAQAGSHSDLLASGRWRPIPHNVAQTAINTWNCALRTAAGNARRPTARETLTPARPRKPPKPELTPTQGSLLAVLGPRCLANRTARLLSRHFLSLFIALYDCGIIR
jgi:hypothetical protein